MFVFAAFGDCMQRVQDHKTLSRLAFGSYKIDQYISLPIQKEANMLA